MRAGAGEREKNQGDQSQAGGQRVINISAKAQTKPDGLRRSVCGVFRGLKLRQKSRREISIIGRTEEKTERGRKKSNERGKERESE